MFCDRLLPSFEGNRFRSVLSATSRLLLHARPLERPNDPLNYHTFSSFVRPNLLPLNSMSGLLAFINRRSVITAGATERKKKWSNRVLDTRARIIAQNLRPRPSFHVQFVPRVCPFTILSTVLQNPIYL